MALADIARILVEHRVEFIIVGGMAAVLQGAPVHTIDLDIVYARTEDNIARLMDALRALEATFRTDARRLVPNETHLRSAGHKLLQTKHGVLDVLGTIEENTSYEDLLPDVDLLDLGGFVVQVISLARLVQVKKKLTRPKDRAMLIILEATLAEKQRSGS
jgi:hypothetical protein